MEIENAEFGFKAFGRSESDRYVYNEIYGREDSYRRNTILPHLRGGIVVEIGAHKGYFTMMAAKLAKRVIAFEPERENYTFLCANILLNDMHDRVTAVNRAVSSEIGEKTFIVSTYTGARHTFFASDFCGPGLPRAVECTTLPELMKDFQIDRIDLLKLDCEGSEYDILLNCDAAVFDKIGSIALEMHESPNGQHNRSEVVDHLRRFGFSVDIYDERSMMPGPIYLSMGWFTRPAANALELIDDKSFLTKVSGLIHVGANIGQERDLYHSYGVAVVWVEPIPDVFDQLVKNIAKCPGQRAIRALLTDKDGWEHDLHISNNSISSSILELGRHTDIWPSVHYVDKIRMCSTRLDTLMQREGILPEQYSALVMDVQGAELLVLKGCGETLRQFRFIKAEAADFESYLGCAQLADLQRHVERMGFREISRRPFARHKAGGTYWDVVWENSTPTPSLWEEKVPLHYSQALPSPA
jgi:FkbM family methyltransferase